MASGLPAPAGVFTRASSGLVRQVGTRDVFAYGWQFTIVPYIVLMVLAWGAYPGASMELATLLAMIGGVAVALCYGLVAQLYPRSGADYVFLSRTLHPAVGFALSFLFTFWMTFYVGVNSAVFGSWRSRLPSGRSRCRLARGLSSGSNPVLTRSRESGRRPLRRGGDGAELVSNTGIAPEIVPCGVQGYARHVPLRVPSPERVTR